MLVPGQVFSHEILSFMRSLDTPEIHGYNPQAGYRVYTGKALEIAQHEAGEAQAGSSPTVMSWDFMPIVTGST